jgi:hypothetical protein
MAVRLYRQRLERVVPVSSPQVAEMVKLLENTFRSVNIGLVNELALMCARMKIDVWEVIEAASTKPFGFMPFFPGPGLGGHCIPIDPFYLSWKARASGFEARFIELAGSVNGQMPEHVVGLVAEALNRNGRPIRGSKILMLGVAYKADIDDTRESPSLDIMEELRERGARIEYSDPYVPTLQVRGIEAQERRAHAGAASALRLRGDRHGASARSRGTRCWSTAKRSWIRGTRCAGTSRRRSSGSDRGEARAQGPRSHPAEGDDQHHEHGHGAPVPGARRDRRDSREASASNSSVRPARRRRGIGAAAASLHPEPALGVRSHSPAGPPRPAIAARALFRARPVPSSTAVVHVAHEAAPAPAHDELAATRNGARPTSAACIQPAITARAFLVTPAAAAARRPSNTG